VTSRHSVAVARRYASALLSVALDKGADLDRIERELREAADLLKRESRLAAVLASPTLASQQRVGVLESVIANADLRPESANLLRLLTSKERIPLLPEVAEQFGRLVLDHKQVQSGEVVSAHPLSDEQQAKLAASLGQALGKTMQLSYRTDGDLVGGLVVRIGNRVYDASVTTQLRRFKERALSRL
jgi:F-type H+-transporting ATPase subunit delta